MAYPDLRHSKADGYRYLELVVGTKPYLDRSGHLPRCFPLHFSAGDCRLLCGGPMTHEIKLEHRTVEAILASVFGEEAIEAFVQRSWMLGGISVLVGAALLITEKADIEEEEQ